MTERRVGLDIAAGGNAGNSTMQGWSSEPDPSASREGAEQFRRALAGQGERESAAAPDAATPEKLRGAFDLFGPRARGAWAAADLEQQSLNDLRQVAVDAAARIRVSADDEREAQVDVSEDVLPGVQVRIRRDQGRWEVTFLVSDSASLELLERSAATLARTLAARLRSAVEVRVTAVGDAERPACTFIADPPAGESE
ncbi:MAG: type III secretion HpaP family protein [Gammaproteobacteria bacterium]